MLCSGPLQAVKGLARQIQGALPVLGLLSRLSSPSGGIGNDILVSSVGYYTAPHDIRTLCYYHCHRHCISDLWRCPLQSGRPFSCSPVLQRYPEFCRKLLYEEASPEFLEATNEWEKAYGKVQSTIPMSQCWIAL